MKTITLERLAAAYGLSGDQQRRLSLMLEELERDEHAPTAVRKPEQAVDIHLADSLVALELDAIRAADSIADLGSGVGFPGLALAVALPATEIALVESRRRECDFLERLRLHAEIENARVVRSRAEEWQQGEAANAAVVARALAAQPVVLEYAAPLLRLGGTLVDWRGKRVPLEEQESLAAAKTLGLRLMDIRRVRPFEDATDRHLHQFVKIEETPDRFPRRAGMARKHPLGG